MNESTRTPLDARIPTTQAQSGPQADTEQDRKQADAQRQSTKSASQPRQDGTGADCDHKARDTPSDRDRP